MKHPSLSDKEYMMLTRDSWRVFRIVSEFVEGFETMTQIGPSVSIFGSSRLGEQHPYYQLAVDTAREIAARGFAIITGGGPGLMQAANQGAQLAHGKSCGLSIEIPTEEGANPFVDRQWNLNFRYFFIRKVMFIRYAQAYVFLPGGFGTLDELFESLTLIQAKKIHPFPIFLMGSEYWKGLLGWLKSDMLGQGCISEKDLKLLTLTDDPKVVADGVESHWRLRKDEPNF